MSHQATPPQARTTGRNLRRAYIILAVWFVLLAAGLAWLFFYTPLGMVAYLAVFQNAGRFDRGHFESVVAEVRKLDLKPGEVHKLRLDDLDDPTSLRPFRDSDIGAGMGEGNVWAEVSAAGKLKVVIQTRDLNHAGCYGFAYSDDPLTPTPFGHGDSNWLQLDVPGDFLNMVLPEMQIDEHWWKVEYNLG